MASGLVFATVGTTKFDSLVRSITRDDCLQALKSRGYTRLRIQIGSGTEVPDVLKGRGIGIDITFYRYKDAIQDDIDEADLVISHAGAGSCLEVLDKGKPLLVVVNEELMHNHQVELAERLSSDGHLYACTPATLADTIVSMDLSKLKAFPKANPNLFPDYLDRFMGFRKED